MNGIIENEKKYVEIINNKVKLELDLEKVKAAYLNAKQELANMIENREKACLDIKNNEENLQLKLNYIKEAYVMLIEKHPLKNMEYFNNNNSIFANRNALHAAIQIKEYHQQNGT